jgi:hypothetical protein
MTPERERAIEAVLSQLPTSMPDHFALKRRNAACIVDALLALPDPVRDAATRVVEAFWDTPALGAGRLGFELHRLAEVVGQPQRPRAALNETLED